MKTLFKIWVAFLCLLFTKKVVARIIEKQMPTRKFEKQDYVIIQKDRESEDKTTWMITGIFYDIFEGEIEPMCFMQNADKQHIYAPEKYLVFDKSYYQNMDELLDKEVDPEIEKMFEDKKVSLWKRFKLWLIKVLS